MAKDKRARLNSRLAVYAVANLTAAIVDAMNEADVPPFTIHRFLDRLDDLNQLQLQGEPLDFLVEIVDVVRRTVGCND